MIDWFIQTLSKCTLKRVRNTRLFECAPSISRLKQPTAEKGAPSKSLVFRTLFQACSWSFRRSVPFVTESQMRTEHCRDEKGKLEGKNNGISEQVSFQGSKWRKHYSACANKEKLMTDIDTDKLAHIWLSFSHECFLHSFQWNDISMRGRQGGRVVSASDSQSGGPGFKSRSGHLLDLCSVAPSSNPRPRL